MGVLMSNFWYFTRRTPAGKGPLHKSIRAYKYFNKRAAFQLDYLLSAVFRFTNICRLCSYLKEANSRALETKWDFLCNPSAKQNSDNYRTQIKSLVLLCHEWVCISASPRWTAYRTELMDFLFRLLLVVRDVWSCTVHDVWIHRLLRYSHLRQRFCDNFTYIRNSICTLLCFLCVLWSGVLEIESGSWTVPGG